MNILNLMFKRYFLISCDIIVPFSRLYLYASAAVAVVADVVESEKVVVLFNNSAS